MSDEGPSEYRKCHLNKQELITEHQNTPCKPSTEHSVMEIKTSAMIFL